MHRINNSPAWAVNIFLMNRVKGWAEFQSGKSMDELFPVIRWLVFGAIPTEGESHVS